MEFLFDYRGVAIAHIQESVIYLISGKPVAYLQNEFVYAYSGRQIGTYEEGRLRDLSGCCVFYNDNKFGFGPIPPIPQIPPIPAIPAIPPIPPIPAIPQIKAIPTTAWSKLSGIQFFD